MRGAKDREASFGYSERAPVRPIWRSEMKDAIDAIARALPDVMSQEVCDEVMGPGSDRLDMAEEWYTSPRELAKAILENLDDHGRDTLVTYLASPAKATISPVGSAPLDVVGYVLAKDEWLGTQDGRRLVRKLMRHALARLGDVGPIQYLIDPLERHGRVYDSPVPSTFEGRHVVMGLASLRE